MCVEWQHTFHVALIFFQGKTNLIREISNSEPFQRICGFFKRNLPFWLRNAAVKERMVEEGGGGRAN